MSVVAIPLSVVLALAAQGTPRAKSPVAMLPVAAERVTLEAVPRLEQLDDRLRRAGATIADVDLIDEARTTANLAAVREMGITCEVDDVPCLGKVAVLVDVDRLIVPIVRIDGDSTTLRLLVVDREGRRAEALRTFTGVLTPDDARSLLAEALAAPVTDPIRASTPPTTTVVAVTRAEPAPSAPPPALDGWWATRVGLAAGGGALALGAGVGAAVVDAGLATPELWAEREGRLRLGQGLVALAVLGGVVGVVGGVLLVVE